MLPRLATDEIRAEHIARALAAFQRTLISGLSPFDRYYFNNEGAALSETATRGFELFRGRAGCTKCHAINGPPATFTDHQFHSLGIRESLLPRLAEITLRVAAAERSELDRLIAEDVDVAELGRFTVTRDPRDIGRFRTPSLRNVGLTAPYMHDGSAATLEAALDSEIYYRG